VTGFFRGTVDFDQTATHAGDTDILTPRGTGGDAYVAKYAPDNSLLWVQRMGGDVIGTPNLDAGESIAVDGSGNVYVSGKFTGSADFGSTTLATAGGADGFVAKLNAGGTVQWAKRWGTSSANDSILAVGAESAGNVYGIGRGAGNVIHILKFGSNGQARWSQSIYLVLGGGTMAVSSSGDVFVAGTFGGTVDFDPGPKTYYVHDGPGVQSGYVLKLDTNGKFKWVSPFLSQTSGSTYGFSSVGSVALDGSGNVIVGGLYENSVDFQPGAGTTTLPTAGGGFVAKLNSAGGLVWARALEDGSGAGVSGLAVRELTVDAAGSIYAAGEFQGTVDLDPGAAIDSRTSAGGHDIFVVKLTSAGNSSWAETLGGTDDEFAGGIAVDPTGGVHLVGSFVGTVDFDPDPFATYYLTTPGTYANAFRLRLGQV
jgi:hypothetical protein